MRLSLLARLLTSEARNGWAKYVDLDKFSWTLYLSGSHVPCLQRVRFVFSKLVVHGLLSDAMRFAKGNG